MARTLGQLQVFTESNLIGGDLFGAEELRAVCCFHAFSFCVVTYEGKVAAFHGNQES